MEESEPVNRASVLYAPGDIRVEERPVPRPGAGEVLVRVRAVGVCGSDVHYYEHGRIGDFVVHAPLVLGHESAGEVVALGPGAHGLRPGQRVSLEPGVPCLACHQCRGGHYNLCPDVRFFGTPPVDGAFQDYVTVPAEFAYPVPDELTDDEAALLEPLSVGIWACRKGGVTAGSRVLVTGVGPIGLIALQVARGLGAAEVVVTDVRANRLELARTLGADAAVDASDGGLAEFEPDVLLECSGTTAALELSMPLVRPAGRVVLVGMGAEIAPSAAPTIQQRELWVTGTFRYANTWPAARLFALSGRVDLTRIVTGHFGLDDVESALRTVRSDPASIKPIVRPGI